MNKHSLNKKIKKGFKKNYLKSILKKDNFKSLNIQQKIIVFFGFILFLLFLSYSIKYLFVFFNPYYNYEPINFDYNSKILIIAPHPDDEAAIAGSIFFEHNKSRIFIIYITTGSFFKNKLINNLYAKERIKEAINAMKFVGIPSENLFFLNYTDQKLLFEKNNIKKAKKTIEHLIKKIKPKIVLVSAYEGGHCIHDLSNIIIKKIQKEISKNITNIKFYEVPEYNEYYNFKTPKKTLSYLLKTLNIDFHFLNRFLPEETQHINYTRKYYYNSTKKSLILKRKLFKKYTTQNFEGNLKRKFFYKEILREIPNYNYKKPPYKLYESFNYYICLFKHLFNRKYCIKYSVCKINFNTFFQVINNTGFLN